MGEILKATPRAILRGIRDLSRRTPVPVAQLIPQHFPLVPILAQRGDIIPHAVVGDGFDQIYGAKSRDPLSEYATHQTVLANQMVSRGNLVMWKRLRPADATTALLRLSLELIPAEVPLWQRENDGSYSLDVNGNRIQLTGEADELLYVLGHRAVWHTTRVPYAGVLADFGKGTTITDFRAGDDPALIVGGVPFSAVVNAADDVVSSKLYPILDLEVADFGAYGNRVAAILSAPNADDLVPGDSSTMITLAAYLYRFAFAERAEDASTATGLETVNGEFFQELTFKSNARHPTTGAQLSVEDRLVQAYQTLTDPTVIPLKGPFGRAHIYKTQLTTVLGLLTANHVYDASITTVGENNYDTTYLPTSTPGVYLPRSPLTAFTGHPERQHLYNILTGVDQDGVPYYTIDLNNSVNYGGVQMGDVMYATGGDDGLFFDAYGKPDTLRNLQLYDELVRAEFTNFGSVAATGWAGLDVARYPFSTIWDSGFTLATKLSMLVPMSKRKNVNVFQATQVVADLDSGSGNWVYQPMNTNTEDHATAVALRTAAQAYPESTIYGTSCCRVVIVGRAGYLLDSLYSGIMPLTMDLADKVANYMGAANGAWTPGQAFDEDPGNVVTLFRDVNITWQSDTSYNSDWDVGLVWVQSYDMHQNFYPAFQTVYPDDTSVLNSVVVMMACCELELVAQAAWRQLTGNTRLSRLQFIDKSNKLIADKVANRFDGRFVIQPETTFTPADNELGYSWSGNIHIYANPMLTVGTMTVVAHRQSDLTTA